jgi:alpha-mannosidase
MKPELVFDWPKPDTEKMLVTSPLSRLNGLDQFLDLLHLRAW